MKNTKVIIGSFFLLFLLLGCKDVKEETLVTSKNTKPQERLDSISNSSHLVQDSLTSKLPIGSSLLLKNELEYKIEEQKKIENLFHYYDTINGIPSPNFKPIKTDKYTALYKPTKADTIHVKDKFALQSKTGYSYFNLVKVLPSINSNQILIFEGKSNIHDYEGNTIYTNRKDLVTVDSKKKIIDEMNIYYDYSDGINARTKLFFIDENYKLSIRYYYENEEGVTKFTPIKNYSINTNGKIISQ